MSQTVFIDCRSVRLFRLTKQQCIPLLVAFKSFGRSIWLSGPLIDADLKKSDTFLNFHKQTPFIQDFCRLHSNQWCVHTYVSLFKRHFDKHVHPI